MSRNRSIGQAVDVGNSKHIERRSSEMSKTNTVRYEPTSDNGCGCFRIAGNNQEGRLLHLMTSNEEEAKLISKALNLLETTRSMDNGL